MLIFIKRNCLAAQCKQSMNKCFTYACTYCKLVCVTCVLAMCSVLFILQKQEKLYFFSYGTHYSTKILSIWSCPMVIIFKARVGVLYQICFKWICYKCLKWLRKRPVFMSSLAK